MSRQVLEQLLLAHLGPPLTSALDPTRDGPDEALIDLVRCLQSPNHFLIFPLLPHPKLLRVDAEMDGSRDCKILDQLPSHVTRSLGSPLMM